MHRPFIGVLKYYCRLPPGAYWGRFSWFCLNLPVSFTSLQSLHLACEMRHFASPLTVGTSTSSKPFPPLTIFALTHVDQREPHSDGGWWSLTISCLPLISSASFYPNWTVSNKGDTTGCFSSCARNRYFASDEPRCWTLAEPLDIFHILQIFGWQCCVWREGKEGEPSWRVLGA